MKYAILYGTLFNRLSHIETIRILGKRLQKAVDSLAVLFGKPSFETLTKELEPLSERYDYVFRMNHVENKHNFLLYTRKNHCPCFFFVVLALSFWRHPQLLDAPFFNDSVGNSLIVPQSHWQTQNACLYFRVLDGDKTTSLPNLRPVKSTCFPNIATAFRSALYCELGGKR